MGKVIDPTDSQCEPDNITKQTSFALQVVVMPGVLKNDPQTSSIFSDNNPVSFRHSKNIRDILVRSSLPQDSSSDNGTFPCWVPQCKICKFIDSSHYVGIVLMNTHTSHIQGRSKQGAACPLMKESRNSFRPPKNNSMSSTFEFTI